jgi:uncharacterized protein involved in exopolysaccharide biosynthesis
MKNKLTNLLLSIALKDIASIIRFVGKLEAGLEKFLESQQAEIDAIDAEITHLASEKAALAGDLTVAQALRGGLQQLQGRSA